MAVGFFYSLSFGEGRGEAFQKEDFKVIKKGPG